MRTIIIILFVLINYLSPAQANADNCYVVKNETKQRTCLIKLVKEQTKNMEEIKLAIYNSAIISSRQKNLVRREQDGWEKMQLEICGSDPYCKNSELEQRINDLTFYLRSFNKRK